MIKDAGAFNRFEALFLANDSLPLSRAFQLVDWLRQEAVTLGVWQDSSPLDSAKTDIKIASILNKCSKN